MGFPLSLTCFLILQLAATVPALPDAGSISSTTKLSLQSTTVSTFHRILPRVSQGKFDIWEMVACSSLPLFIFWWAQRRWKENSTSLALSEENKYGASKGRNMNGSTDTGKFLSHGWKPDFTSDFPLIQKPKPTIRNS